jgi:hypothetical protein
VLTVKFATLAAHECYPVLQVCDMLEPWLVREYSATTSPAVQALSRCVTRMIAEIPAARLSDMLNEQNQTYLPFDQLFRAKCIFEPDKDGSILTAVVGDLETLSRKHTRNYWAQQALDHSLSRVKGTALIRSC